LKARGKYLPVFPARLVDMAVRSASHFAALVVEEVLHFGPLVRGLHFEVEIHFAPVNPWCDFKLKRWISMDILEIKTNLLAGHPNSKNCNYLQTRWLSEECGFCRCARNFPQNNQQK